MHDKSREDVIKDQLTLFFLVSMAVQSSMLTIQYATSCYFFSKTETIREVGPITKKLVVVGNVVGFNYVAMTMINWCHDMDMLSAEAFSYIIYCFWLPNTFLIFYTFS